MRRGNPFADGLPHLRSQWIALSLTLRAMTIRRECLSPCRPVPGLLRAKALANLGILYCIEK